jgi:hypothetical protein
VHVYMGGAVFTSCIMNRGYNAIRHVLFEGYLEHNLL